MSVKEVSLTKKISQFFWRSWAIQDSWNYERQMNMGFLYGIAPTIDRCYPDESDPKQLELKKEAYKRHMAFYNCTPQTSAFVLGLAASMEEEYAQDQTSVNPDAINAMKTSLMGPLSGIGGSLFQGTIRGIAFGLGVALAQQGSILGPCDVVWSKAWLSGRSPILKKATRWPDHGTGDVHLRCCGINGSGEHDCLSYRNNDTLGLCRRNIGFADGA